MEIDSDLKLYNMNYLLLSPVVHSMLLSPSSVLSRYNYRIFRPITRALSIQKGSEIVKNEHARYMLERFPTDKARVICTKKGIGKYGIMY